MKPVSRFFKMGLPVLAGVALAWGGQVLASESRRSLDILSRPHTLDRIYRSMRGPFSTQKFFLGDPSEPQLLWITGYHARMVATDGRSPVSQEYMCHSNLDIEARRHIRLFQWKKKISSRLFTLSQGQMDIRFPEGFGIPLLSSERLSLTTQALNLNPLPDTLGVRHQVTLDYVWDRELDKPMKPLFMTGANGLALLEGETGHYNLEDPDTNRHGEGCLVGRQAGKRVLEDGFGRKFTGHWVVKPGRQVNHTLVTRWMDLPFDTTVHYIAVHLHPFAESLELKDLTTGETVFKSSTKAFPDRIGIERVDAFSSEEGVRLYKNHEYQIISVYNNTTSEDQDAMAVMFLYLWDKDFKKPA